MSIDIANYYPVGIHNPKHFLVDASDCDDVFGDVIEVDAAPAECSYYALDKDECALTHAVPVVPETNIDQNTTGATQDAKVPPRGCLLAKSNYRLPRQPVNSILVNSLDYPTTHGCRGERKVWFSETVDRKRYNVNYQTTTPVAGKIVQVHFAFRRYKRRAKRMRFTREAASPRQCEWSSCRALQRALALQMQVRIDLDDEDPLRSPKWPYGLDGWPRLDYVNVYYLFNNTNWMTEDNAGNIVLNNSDTPEEHLQTPKDSKRVKKFLLKPPSVLQSKRLDLTTKGWQWFDDGNTLVHVNFNTRRLTNVTDHGSSTPIEICDKTRDKNAMEFLLRTRYPIRESWTKLGQTWECIEAKVDWRDEINNRTTHRLAEAKNIVVSVFHDMTPQCAIRFQPRGDCEAHHNVTSLVCQKSTMPIPVRKPKPLPKPPMRMRQEALNLLMKEIGSHRQHRTGWCTIADGRKVYCATKPRQMPNPTPYVKAIQHPRRTTYYLTQQGWEQKENNKDWTTMKIPNPKISDPKNGVNPPIRMIQVFEEDVTTSANATLKETTTTFDFEELDKAEQIWQTRTEIDEKGIETSKNR